MTDSTPLKGQITRALDVLAREGLRGLGIRLLSMTVYRRLVVMALPFEEVRTPPSPPLAVMIESLSESRLDDYLHFRPDTDPDEVRRRLSAGYRCFVAVHESRIVHAGWAATTKAWVEYLGCELPLRPGDVYVFDSFTAQGFRGLGISQARIASMTRAFGKEGYHSLVAAVLPENPAAFRPLEAMGYRALGKIGVIRVGSWHLFSRGSWRAEAASRSSSPGYWDEVVGETLSAPAIGAWRVYMRRVYADLITRWMPSDSGVGLKTDLFEEAVTHHNLLAELGVRRIGLDVSPAVVRAARARFLGEGRSPHFVVGDLRRIPLHSGSMTRILAGSSLDHFAVRADLDTGLAELARVLAPGGVMVVTLDNPHNPLIWLRNHLPFAWLKRIGLVPYFVGHTLGRDEVLSRLAVLGLDAIAIGAVAHAPRAPAIWLARLAERHPRLRSSSRLDRLLWAFEALGRWPTRYWTGYYVAIVARKKQTPPATA